MSSSASGYATSLARQQHQPPPKVLEALPSTPVSDGRALDALCAFLAAEKAKLSHLDLQQHWMDLHGVATALCRQEEAERGEGGGTGGAGEDGDAEAARRHARALEQMMLDVDAVRNGGGYDGPATPSGASRHVAFPRDGADDDDDEARDDDIGMDPNAAAAGQSPPPSEASGSNKKKARKEKKELKKAAKRERKEAKKRLKKEARKSEKRH